MQRILLMICWLAVACNTQTAPPEKATDTTTSNSDKPAADVLTTETLPTDSAIVMIRKIYQQINAMPLTQQNFKWTAENCNGDGTATYYLTQNNEIAKVVETGAIGDGSWTTAYYYHDGHFVFSLQTDIGGPAIGPVDTIITRKYVYGNKVIRSMRNDTYDTNADSVLTPASKEYKILEAYKSKNFGAAFCE